MTMYKLYNHYIDSGYPVRQKIPSGKSLTSVDIVFNSSEILTLNPITDSWVMTVQVVCNTVAPWYYRILLPTAHTIRL